jgi:Zn-finger nucleic acid-binding protein
MPNCPSCHRATTPTTFSTHLGTPVEIDICWPCHLIWFDHLESTSLSAQSVIDLFRRIHAHRADDRNIVSLNGNCPTCSTKLALTNDIGRSGRFSYYRCPHGHGRLISFVQFLREKNFVRTLNAAELQTLAVTVKQVRCSSCGAGINIEHDSACTHCGAPISVLDEQAVAKALHALDDKANRPRTQAPAHTSTHTPSPAPYSPNPSDFVRDNSSSGLTDLLLTGLAAVLAATLD